MSGADKDQLDDNSALERLLDSVPNFKVTTRPQGRSERGNTDTLYGIRTAGELSREITRRLTTTPK